MDPLVRTAARQPLAAGETLAPGLEVVEHLSRGRRLDVYDSWSEHRGCRCVVKTIRPERAHEQEAREALIREGELLEHLAHPHIVRAYGTLVTPRPMVVMETLPGETLEYVLAEADGPATSQAVSHLALHLGSAIRFLHRHGIVHLDLKPGNIVADRGLAKLIDLSVAQPPGPCRPGTGTWGYMAPEQALGEEVTEAADVWGLGVVLFEVATGQPAFDDPEYEDPPTSAEGGDQHPLQNPQVTQRAPGARLVRPDLSPTVAEVIDRCLEPEPCARPSIEAVLSMIEPAARIAPTARRWTAR
jgi:eukaryotic-like serine/threonine-protein kinase